MKRYFKLSYWKDQRLLLLVFLCVHVIVSSVYITWQNITFDEKDYYAYSVQWLHGDVSRDKEIYDSKSPITVIAAIPRIARQLVNPVYKTSDEGISDILAGRYLMVLFTLIIAVYLFRWTRHLHGAKAWIIPLLFFLFDPLVMGYSMIITSDMASGACLLATCYHLSMLYQHRNRRQLLWFALWLGISFVCKASLLYFIPYLALLAIILMITGKLRLGWKRWLACIAIISSVSLLVVNLTYFGEGSFRTLGEGKFRSSTFISLSGTAAIRDIPVPLPFSYVQSLDMLQYHGSIGAGHPESTHHGSFIGDKMKHQSGFWYYYLYTGLFKIPIATLLLIVSGLAISVLFFRKRFIEQHLWYILPFIFFFIVLSILNPFQTGIRHLLLVYPFCFLLVATAVAFFQERFNFGRIGMIALLSYMLISTAFFYPWLIPYTNELVTDKKNVLRKIKDSSIDYGHNVYQLIRFVKAHPDYGVASFTPKAGRYIVPAFQLVPYMDRENASWMNAFEPVGHHQFSMFLFDISEEDISAIKKQGPPR